MSPFLSLPSLGGGALSGPGTASWPQGWGLPAASRSPRGRKEAVVAGRRAGPRGSCGLLTRARFRGRPQPAGRPGRKRRHGEGLCGEPSQDPPRSFCAPPPGLFVGPGTAGEGRPPCRDASQWRRRRSWSVGMAGKIPALCPCPQGFRAERKAALPELPAACGVPSHLVAGRGGGGRGSGWQLLERQAGFPGLSLVGLLDQSGQVALSRPAGASPYPCSRQSLGSV